MSDRPRMDTLVVLNAALPKALGWVQNCDERWSNPKAPNMIDQGFVCLDHFNPVWHPPDTQIVLDHMRLRSYDYTLDTFGEDPGKPFQALFILKGKPDLFEACGQTQAIAICAAALLALKAAEKKDGN